MITKNGLRRRENSMVCHHPVFRVLAKLFTVVIQVMT